MIKTSLNWCILRATLNLPDEATATFENPHTLKVKMSHEYLLVLFILRGGYKNEIEGKFQTVNERMDWISLGTDVLKKEC